MTSRENIIETTHDLDALIRAARHCPTENIIERLIDAEIDYHGRWVGFDAANSLWHKVIPCSASRDG